MIDYENNFSVKKVTTFEGAIEWVMDDDETSRGKEPRADRRKYMGGPGEDWATRARRGDEAML